MTENERAVVQVSLTARDKKRVEALAASDEVTVSDVVRQLILAELREERVAGTRLKRPSKQ